MRRAAHLPVTSCTTTTDTPNPRCFGRGDGIDSAPQAIDMFASTLRRKGPPVSTEPFEQACAASRQVLAGVRADQLANATPCASWDVAGLINHIVGGQHFFADGMEGKPPSESGDYASGDYMDSFDQAAARVTAVFQQDGALGRIAKMPFGEMPGGAVLGIATSDVFVHGWDLAKATEQDTKPGARTGGSDAGRCSTERTEQHPRARRRTVRARAAVCRRHICGRSASRIPRTPGLRL